MNNLIEKHPIPWTFKYIHGLPVFIDANGELINWEENPEKIILKAINCLDDKLSNN